MSTVSADQLTKVGKSQTENIGINKSLTVGTNQFTRVGKDMTLQVGGNFIENVATNRTMTSGKQMLISAEDQLFLKSGKSSIVLNKNGEIDIKGKNIFIKSSGTVTIKGSKVTTN